MQHAVPARSASRAPLIRPGETCWTAPIAARAACLIDNQAYFRLLKRALARAERSIAILGWAFDPRTRLDPEARGGSTPDAIGALLNARVEATPGLDVRLLIWNMALPIAATLDLFPHRASFWLDERIALRLADDLPFGACHHQKLVVIDDSLAFVSGDDISPDRWDSPAHLGRDRRRAAATGWPYPPHHGLTLMVEGEAARALGDVARERWEASTDEPAPAPGPVRAGLWPREVRPDLRDAPLAIARTLPEHRERPAVREGEALILSAIAAARRLVYFENQYLAAPAIGEALAARLAEPDGPEIVCVLSPHSPSYFDRLVMDSARDALVADLLARDPHRRFRAFAPHAADGRPVIVHSKAMVIDDRLFRLGSANLNNRSLGFDSELDVALEAPSGPEGAAARRAIGGLVDRFVAHFIDRPAAEVAAARARMGLIAALGALDGGRRLRPLAPTGAGFLGALSAAHHLGDPPSPEHSWRPWRRRAGPARLGRAHAIAGAALAAAAGYALVRGLRSARGR